MPGVPVNQHHPCVNQLLVPCHSAGCLSVLCKDKLVLSMLLIKFQAPVVQVCQSLISYSYFHEQYSYLIPLGTAGDLISPELHTLEVQMNMIFY